MSDIKQWFNRRGDKVQLQLQPTGVVTVEVFDYADLRYFFGHVYDDDFDGVLKTAYSGRATYALDNNDLMTVQTFMGEL